ncbi:MAG: matrixin family metalloprotease [Planctomycetes bacterium]|nr:matrixin family metalloprotease [Planctomycetota bacterium]
MGNHTLRRSLPYLAALFTLGVAAAGCESLARPGAAPSEPATVAPAARSFQAPPADAAVLAETEPNDDPTSAASAGPEVDRYDGGFFIDGRIADRDDVDVYALGAMESGDLVSVRIESAGDVYLKAALLDAQQRLLTLRYAERFPDGNVVYLTHSARAPGDVCYLAIAPLGPRTNAVGAYRAGVVWDRGGRVPAPRPQHVLLDFNGNTVAAGSFFGDTSIAPFDAATIAPQFAGQTERIIADVVDRVREKFTGLDVTVYASIDELAPEAEISVVHVGGAHDALLGLAEAVDEYNADPTDRAVIYVDAFGQFMVLEPSAEQIAHALANVITHEIGHLLGLLHTRESSSVMDISASMGHLLSQRSFGLHPLDGAGFPLGLQDGPTRLLQTVGGDSDYLAEHRAAKFSLAPPYQASPRDAAAAALWPMSPLSSCQRYDPPAE